MSGGVDLLDHRPTALTASAYTVGPAPRFSALTSAAGFDPPSARGNTFPGTKSTCPSANATFATGTFPAVCRYPIRQLVVPIRLSRCLPAYTPSASTIVCDGRLILVIRVGRRNASLLPGPYP